MKNILITGGAGFIGSNLSLKLIEKGYQITILDNLSPQIHGNNPNSTSPLYNSVKEKTNIILGSVTSKSDWIKAIENQDAIIHLAAETGTGQSMYEIQKYCDVNVMGTAIMLDILANTKHSIQKIIVASSRAIYGEGKYECQEHSIVYPNERNDSDMQNGDFECKCPICGSNLVLLPTTENSKIHPSSIYGITKQNQEQMVLTVGKALGIPAIAFRYQNVYGVGQSLSNPYTGILSIFSTLMLKNKSINIFEDGNESRDFVYIDDVVNATIAGLENDTVSNMVFNVGTGKAETVKSIVDTLLEKYNTSSQYSISGNYRLGDIRHNFADISLAKKHLKFNPAIDIKTGLSKFTEWVKLQDTHSCDYEKSLNEMRERKLFK
ncbi:nucleoside-diphosphate-sugar epimerase [Bacteroidia bacterium]|nr:nucleoside-diphosphate-sugar epimerase [Bacteroidia bacterium]GHT85925.1 nucleoside-diphosphate-sugar epimerase [Bacteroidia bacterium]GHU82961.1 nucleoside-diphosphate-sugar epimerase [Bacteroidia bacterium]